MIAPVEAKEVMRLSMITGKVLKRAMTNRGINIIRINFMEAGNWAAKSGKSFFIFTYKEEMKRLNIRFGLKQYKYMLDRLDFMILLKH